MPVLGKRGTWGGAHGASGVLEGEGFSRGELMGVDNEKRCWK